MRILIVAATEFEVSMLREELKGRNRAPAKEQQDIETEVVNEDQAATPGTLDFEVLITGVGMVATAFALGKHLPAKKYDLVVNLGICGSFDRNIALGDVLEITEDTFSELGAENDAEFLPIDKMGFGEGTFYPPTKLDDLYNLFNTFNLKTATAITVNTVHGNSDSINQIKDRLNPGLESMEGAAFFYACREMNVPCLQIRAVSNYVEKRNRDNWQIGLAIKNLNTFAIEFLKLYA